MKHKKLKTETLNQALELMEELEGMGFSCYFDSSHGEMRVVII